MSFWDFQKLSCRAFGANFSRSFFCICYDGKRLIYLLMSFWNFPKLSFVFAPPGLTFCALSFVVVGVFKWHACMHDMHAWHACMTCMHDMHAWHACIPCMHAMHVCHFLNHLWVTMMSLLDYLGIIWASLWTTLGSTWMTLGSLWDDFGVTLGWLRGLPWSF